MLGHKATGCGDHKRRRGGYVEQVGTVTAGAHDIHQRVGVDRYAGGQLPHDFGGAGDFVDGFALDAQPHEKGPNLRIGGFTLHDDAHNVLHFLRGQVQIGGDAVQCFFHVHVVASYCVFRKLRSSS